MRATAFGAVAAVLLQVHLTPARAGAPETVSRRLIARFTSVAAAAHALAATGRAGAVVIRRLGTSSVDPPPAPRGRTATGGRLNLHLATGGEP